MTIKIIGVDVSKASVSCCLLSERPINPRDFYYRCEFHKFSASRQDIEKLLALKPDVAVIEPTGVNYSRLWVEHLSRAGCEIRLCGHKELRNYRAHQLALPDKDDDADALALACYFFDYQHESSRFLHIRNPQASRIRDLFFRLEHLNHVQSPIVNRLRQDLAWQFPEIALVRAARGVNGDTPLIWDWISGARESTRYKNLYKNTIGLGLTQSSRYHAERLCSLQREEMEIEEEIYKLLRNQAYAPYLEIFDRFQFGIRLKALLVSQIFPFDKYLVNGQPEIICRKGRISGKQTLRYLSERRFLKSLGVAPSQEQSGDSKKQRVTGGSSMCRRALWLWLFTSVEVKKRRKNIPFIEAIAKQLDEEKASGKPIQLVRSRACAKAGKLLFKELVRTFC
jgi:transposase